MGPFRIQQKVLFSVKELISSSGHVVIFAVLTDLTKIQITAVAPISYTNKVKVRWYKDKSLIHYVLLEIRHHSVGEIVETIVHGSTDRTGVKPLENDGYRGGYAGNATHGARIIQANVSAIIGTVFVHDGLDLTRIGCRVF